MAVTKTIKLDPPLTHEGARIDSLMLVEPRAGQVLAAEKKSLAESGVHAQRVRDAELVALVARVPAEVLRSLPTSVFREAAAFLNDFSKAPSEGEELNREPELVITIDPPIERNNRVFDVLELRQPNCGEAEAAERELGVRVTDESMRRYQIMLVSRVSGLPRFAIEALPISVLDQASQYLLGFM